MRIYFILVLFMVSIYALADSAIIFEKSTAKLMGQYNPDGTTNSYTHFSNVCSNYFDMFQPYISKYDGNKLLGRQVVKRIDWELYDMALFVGSTPTNEPSTTNDLDGIVTPVNVYAIQQAEKIQKMDEVALRDWGESNILVIADSFGITNRPVRWTKLSNKVEDIGKTNEILSLQIGLKLQQYLLFYTMNGGNAWKIGAHK